MYNLAGLYVAQGRHDEAEAIYREGLDYQQHRLGSFQDASSSYARQLGRLYEQQGRYDEAETLYLEMVEAGKGAPGEYNKSTRVFMNRLAQLYMKQSRYDEAEPLYLELLETRRRVLGDNHRSTLASMNSLAWLLLTREPASSRDPQTALQLALDVAQKTDFKNPGYLDTLSLAYHLTGDTEKAIETQRGAISLLAEGADRSEYEEHLQEFEDALQRKSQ
jgi:tetratricopeptide (TPR) repeat protein